MRRFITRVKSTFQTMVGVVILLVIAVCLIGEAYHFFFDRPQDLDEWFGRISILLLAVVIFLPPLIEWIMLKKKS